MKYCLIPKGNTKAKAAGIYKGRPEDTKRNDGIAAMLRSGKSWSMIQSATGLQPRNGREDRETNGCKRKCVRSK
jgi:hypothetical protein